MSKVERIIQVSLKDPDLSAKARGRFSILLDMNVWIDLAEGREPQAVRIRERLRHLVEGGTLFCPLVPTIIWELFKQSYDSALKVAAVMEELSLGITFAPTEEIYSREVEVVFDAIHSDTQPRTLDEFQLFVPIIAYLASSGHFHFPNVAAFKDPERLSDAMAQHLIKIGLVELCRMMHSGLSQVNVPAPKFAETGIRRKGMAGKSREKTRRIEEEAVTSGFVTPRLTRLCHIPEPLDLAVLAVYDIA